MRDPHPIIAQVAALREAAGVTQTEVAARIHYTRQSVGYWEGGKTEPCTDAIAAYANALGYRLTVDGSHDPISAVLGKRRVDAGLTQTDIALKLGCRSTTVGRWESGRRGMTLRSASAYAGLFGLELELREAPRG